jgi:hypothetical protein
MNPLRFKRRGTDINYQTRLPRYDLMERGVQYQKGIHVKKDYYPDHMNGAESLRFEIITNTAARFIQAILYQPDGTTRNFTITEITPTGWTLGQYIITFSINTFLNGLHRASINTTDGWYDSDIFMCNPYGANAEKNLVEFRYWDDQNRYASFFTGDNGNWRPAAYYTGVITETDGETEQSLFIDQPGNPVLLETTESDGLTVTLTDLTDLDYKRIKWMRKCDNLYVNDSKVTCLEISQNRKDPNSNMIDVILRCAYSENNGYYV